MSKPVILVVESDGSYYNRICAAFDQYLLPRPDRVSSGEDAILWVAANRCDLCILAYELPGMDGIETLIRMRQRKPELKVIMTAGVNSEAIAVAAFRNKVHDYVAKSHDSPLTIAQQVNDLFESSKAERAPAVRRGASNAPAPLQEPTYQNRLRVIGREIDKYGYSGVNIVEVGGGFLVRALPRGKRVPEALEFPDYDFSHLVARAYAARGEERWERPKTELFPTGYEDFLRAIGHRLDARIAEAISIAELGDVVAVGGLGKVDETGATQIKPFNALLRQDEIEFVLNQAFRRRHVEPEQSRRRGFRRFMREF